MIYRLAASNAALFVIILLVAIGTLGVMTDQVEFLIESHQLDFIPGEIQLEENIVILVAAFGVFLEHRRYLLVEIYKDRIPPRLDELDRFGHRAGVMFIMVAIFIEGVDLLFLAISTWHMQLPLLKYLEVLILFSLNIGVCVMFARFAMRLLAVARDD